MPSPTEIKAHENVLVASKRTIKGYGDRFKVDETSSKIMAHLSAPFNPNYMSMHTTRKGRFTYWGKNAKLRVQMAEWAITKTRAHEGQHMVDWGFLFPLLYGMPHSLAPLFFIPFVIFGGWWALLALGSFLAGVSAAYVWPTKPAWFWTWASLGIVGMLGLGVWRVQWHTFWLAGFFLLLSPVLNYLGAARYRAWAEFRGYTMSIAFEYWKTGNVSQMLLERVHGHFTGSVYYFMLPWSKYVERRIIKIVDSLQTGEILKNPWAKKMYEALYQAGACYIEYPGYKSSDL